MQAKSNKAAYEVRRSDGTIYGAIGPRDWDRFRQTLRFVPKDVSSLLDAGCDRGHWLSYVASRRRAERLVGIDVSQGRIEEARERYPGLDFRARYLEDLGTGDERFDVVTCLEVLEHVPDWLSVFEALLVATRRRLLITVPYRETIRETNCVHCGKMTPMHGHLRSYDESSFPPRPGWQLHFSHINDYGIGTTPVRRLYRTIRPSKNWLVVCYDAIA